MIVIVVIVVVLVVAIAGVGALLYLRSKKDDAPTPGPPPGPGDVDCVYTTSDWDPQTCPCGGGQRTRTNTITTPSAGNGAICPPATETRTCTAPACPPGTNRDCEFTTTGWQPEVCPCGGGTQTKTNTIVAEATGTGMACPPATETRTCSSTGEGCQPIDCVYAVSDWEPAQCPCGGGTQTRSVVVTTPAAFGGSCQLPPETQTCTADPCPVDCVYETSAWSPSGCSCGQTLTQYRSNTVITPAAHGGQACPPAVESKQCVGAPCPPPQGNCTYTICVFGCGDATIQNTEAECNQLCNNPDVNIISNCRWTRL